MSRRWDEASGVVTPEAVVLQFSEANVGSRAAAFFIDAALLIVLLVILNASIGFLFADTGGGLPDWVGITALLVVNFLVFFGYPIMFETVMHGRTPGKAALGLRVVTVEGAPERFRHAAIRAALGLVDFILTSGVAAVLTTLLSKRHQRLGDMVAGTVVLRERSAAAPPVESRFRVPAGAESYAATLDPSGLPARDYEAVREFLLRASRLQPTARTDLARQLATTIATKLGHTPPASVSPELFLVCLAARYQQREQPPAAPAAPAPAQPPPPADAGEPAGDTASDGEAPPPDGFAAPR